MAIALGGGTLFTVGLLRYEADDEGEIWQFIGQIGGSVRRCLADGDGLAYLLDQFSLNLGNASAGSVPHPCDNETDRDGGPAPLAENEMWEPTGLSVLDDGAADPEGLTDYRVFVADRLNSRIVVYDYGGSTVAVHSSFTRPADATAHPFFWPDSVAVDPAGNLIVVESWNSRLLILDSHFVLTKEIRYPTGARPLNVSIAPGTTLTPLPAAECVNGIFGTGRVAVALTSPHTRDEDEDDDEEESDDDDSGDDDESGDDDDESSIDITDLNTAVIYDEHLCRITALGQENAFGLDTPGNFAYPPSVHIDTGGRVWVTDYFNLKVEVFEKDANNPTVYNRLPGLFSDRGQVVDGGEPSAPAQLSGPYGVVVDHRGRLAVVDYSSHRLAVYLPPWHPENPTHGTADSRWRMQFQLIAEGALNGAWPSAIAEDSQQRWLVTSASHDNVFVFQIPQLAVFDLRTSESADPSGAFNVLRVSFKITVPVGHPTATGVQPQLTPIFTPAESQEDWIPGQLSLLDGPVNAFNDSAFVPATIRAGEYVPVYYRYRVDLPGDVRFKAEAFKVTPAGPYPAPAKLVDTEAVGPGCELGRPTVAQTINSPSIPVAIGTVPGYPELTEVYGNDVAIRFSASDAGSEIREIRYEYIEGPRRGETGVFSGASGDLTVSWENSESYLHGIRYYSVDNCGNRSDDADDDSDDSVVKVYIDRTPPAAQAILTGLIVPGFSGIYQDRVTIGLTGTDNASGIDPNGFRFSLAGPKGRFERYTSPMTLTSTGTIWFRAKDLADNQSGVGKATFTVNHAPAAADDSVATTEDTAISTINVLLNDADPDGDTLTVTEVTPVIGGTPSLQSDGTVRFTPSPNFNGLASFSYAIADGRGGVATAAVAVNVTAASDPPAAPNISMTTIETTPVTITPAIVDPDSDDTLTLSVATAPSNGTAVPVGNTLVYSARPTYIGPDAFTYRVTDSSGLSATGTVTIVVKRRNAAPVCSTAAPVFAWPPNHKQLHKFTITGITDADRDPLTVAITAILQDEPVDTTADGKFTPDASFSGATFWVRAERMGGSNGRVYEIRFTVTDGVGGSCSGTRLAVVPHAMGRQPRWVDDGVRYNSLAVVPSARNKK